MEKRAFVEWRGGLEFDAIPEQGARVHLSGAGNGLGHRPAGLLLAALAACSGMDTISVLAKKRQVVDEYHVMVEGEQREGHPRTYSRVVVEHVLEGELLDDAAVARAVELSATRYCVVNAHLSAGDTVVHHRYTIRDAVGERSGEVVVTGPQGAGLAVLAVV